MTAVVLALFPELTDVNGDAQNALVLARRAQWAGIDAEVRSLHAGERAPGDRPAAVVLGSGVDSALRPTIEALQHIREDLQRWLRSSVPLFAVGTGLEVLSRRILLSDGPLDGIGLLAADAVPLAVRVADDLVVDASEGRLVGYENHARGLRLEPGVEPLGTVVQGVGDGWGVDGVRHAGVIGTRMHGPVLAKNPALADAVLALAFERPIHVTGAAAAAADAAAAAARQTVLAQLIR